MSVSAEYGERRSRPERYVAPFDVQRLNLQDALLASGREAAGDRQLDLLRERSSREAFVYCAGDLALLRRPSVAIVGAREVSHDGKSRAYKLAKELAEAGVTVVSGLAKGVDTAAHLGALENGGRTVAVIGTPVDKAYPAENKRLQEEIYRDHLLLSPFAVGEAVFKANFPKRNRVMALLSDATVIVEASDTSGSLHQAAECVRSNRWLFIMKSVLAAPSLTWPARFLGQERVVVLSSTQEIVDRIA